jgi:acetoin utilization deacetylase AcuC-like enzyme
MTTPPVLVIEDPTFLEHRSPQGHPERPQRLEAVGQALAAFEASLDRRPARAAVDDELLAIHDAGHLREIANAAAHAPAHLDADTYVSARSEEVARLAAGSAIDLALAACRPGGGVGIAAVRPPGHHAEGDRAMGFCLFNNVAVAARALQREAGLEKVMIVDWDVHHGNGTQHSFEADPSVLYFSTHQYPYYPGTGDAREAGEGRGVGATVNVPMPAGCGDAEYVGVLQRVLAPVTHSFSPDMILVSCGFDAHADDPLAAMEVSGRGFLEMTRIVRSLAHELCGGRLCFVLEGGYALTGLTSGTEALLTGLTEDPGTELAAAQPLEAGSMLRSIVDRVASVHGAHHPGIGAA